MPYVYASTISKCSTSDRYSKEVNATRTIYMSMFNKNIVIPYVICMFMYNIFTWTKNLLNKKNSNLYYAWINSDINHCYFYL